MALPSSYSFEPPQRDEIAKMGVPGEANAHFNYATGSHTVFHHRTELEKLADAAKPINRHKSMKVNGALSYVDIR